MMVEELKEHLLQKPFRPFQIVLKNGERLDVARFGQVGIGSDRKAVLRPNQLAALETLAE